MPELCPYCEKPALGKEVVDGVTRYVHQNTADTFSGIAESKVSFGFTYCPEPPKSGS